MFGKFPDQKVSKAMTSFPVYYWSQLTQIPNGFLTRPVLKISICFEPCFQIMDCAILPDSRKRREHCQVSCTEALVWYDGLHEVHQWQLEDAGFFTARQQLVVNASTAISLVKATWLALHGHPMESSHLRLYTGYRIQTSTYCFILTAEKRWKTFQPVSPLVTLHCTDISKFIGLQSAFHSASSCGSRFVSGLAFAFAALRASAATPELRVCIGTQFKLNIICSHPCTYIYIYI